MKNDFFVTVGDGNGGEQIILIWVPLAILAHNVVLENGGNPEVAHKASVAVIQHGKEIDYEQDLSVRRQVIMAARKAADAVIEELGNGDVAAAVLEAVREGGESLFCANASGIAIDAMNQDAEGGDNNVSSKVIHITLSKPLGITFEPIGDAQECGVRILDLPSTGKAYLSKELKVGDELVSVDNQDVSDLTYYEVVSLISGKDSRKQIDLVFKRRNKRELKAAIGRKFRGLIKRSANKKGNQVADLKDDEAQSAKKRETPSTAHTKHNTPEGGPSKKNNRYAGRKDDEARSREVNSNSTNRSAKKKGNQLSDKRDSAPSTLQLEHTNSVKKSSSKKGAQFAEQKVGGDSSLGVKQKSTKNNPIKKDNQQADHHPRSPSKKDNQQADHPRSPSKNGSQQADRQPRNPSKKDNQQADRHPKSPGKKDNQHADQRDDGASFREENDRISPSPVSTPKKSNATKRKPKTIQSDAQSVKSYGSLASEKSSFGFFGLWPTSSQVNHDPSHLIPNWSSSQGSTFSQTDESYAIKDLGLSKLWGRAFGDHGRYPPEDYSFTDGQFSLDERRSWDSYSRDSYSRDSYSQGDYSHGYSQGYSQGYSTQDYSSYTDDYSSRASSYTDEYSNASTFMSREPAKKNKFRPIKELRKRFAL